MWKPIYNAMSVAFITLLLLALNGAQAQQAFYPGQFSIDGIPVRCGSVIFVLDPNLNDVGIADGRGHIFLNPTILSRLPTVLKLYWAAHECGHYFVGASEVGADCWAIKTGRDQGWFPPHAFDLLMQMFQNNPGDVAHPSGRQRVANMKECYRN